MQRAWYSSNTAHIIVHSQTLRIIYWQLSIKMASYICHMYIHVYIYICLTNKCLLLGVGGVDFRQRFMLENIEINRFNHQKDDMITLFLWQKGNIYIFRKWTVIHVKQGAWLYIICTRFQTFNTWTLLKVALNTISQNNTSINKWMWVYSMYLKNYTNFILYVTVDWPNAVIIKWIEYIVF